MNRLQRLLLPPPSPPLPPPSSSSSLSCSSTSSSSSSLSSSLPPLLLPPHRSSNTPSPHSAWPSSYGSSGRATTSPTPGPTCVQSRSFEMPPNATAPLLPHPTAPRHLPQLPHLQDHRMHAPLAPLQGESLQTHPSTWAAFDLQLTSPQLRHSPHFSSDRCVLLSLAAPPTSRISAASGASPLYRRGFCHLP